MTIDYAQITQTHNIVAELVIYVALSNDDIFTK